jgi:fatty acid desaturase
MEKKKLSSGRGMRRFFAFMGMAIIWGLAFTFAYKYALAMPIAVFIAPVYAYLISFWAEQDKDPREGIFLKSK